MEIARGAIVLVGAFGGVYLALLKYKSEKRWEARHLAYQDIFRALADIDAWVEEVYASCKLLPSLNDEKLSGLGEKYDTARHALWRHVKVGGLIISSLSVAALNDLVAELEGERIRHADDAFDDSNRDQVLAEHCEKLRAILSKNVPVIMRHAKADLR